MQILDVPYDLIVVGDAHRFSNSLAQALAATPGFLHRMPRPEKFAINAPQDKLETMPMPEPRSGSPCCKDRCRNKECNLRDLDHRSHRNWTASGL